LRYIKVFSRGKAAQRVHGGKLGEKEYAILCPHNSVADYAQTSISNTLTNLEVYVVGSPIENSLAGHIKLKYAETLANYTLVSVYIPFEG